MVALPDSQWADLDGPVHYVDWGGPAGGAQLVLVHGLGGSHVNWAAVGPELARTCRVVALDLAGFGLTRGQGRSTSVQGNRRLLHQFVTSVTGGPVILVGNSMGGMICALEAAAEPDAVAGVVLVDPVLPVALRAKPDPRTLAIFSAYVTPMVGRLVVAGRRRVRTAEQVAMDTLRLCCTDPDRVPPEVVRAHVEFARSRPGYPELEQEFLVATRSLMWTLARRRQYGQTLRRIASPVLMLHGDRDRLVSIGSARAAARANPAWRLEVAHDMGHVPQLEAPGWTAATILAWLDEQGGPAADRAAAARPPKPASRRA